jgi:hypothetical protein
MVSGSDRSADAWREDYRIEGTDDLALHHLYRAMGWLGEELPDAEQTDRTPFAPRCLKDVVEERLFEARRDLFSELSVVFMDTTSLYFEGAGGESLGQRGHSKDHRPDLMQMIVAVVMDQRGRPLCCEMWPGNATDVTALIPVVDRLRRRFGIGRVCVVADRGMISAQTLAALEARGLEYVLGVRERSAKEVRTLVLSDDARFVPLVIPVGRSGRGWGARPPTRPANGTAGYQTGSQGGDLRRPPLHRLPQPGRSREGRRRPGGDRGQPAPSAPPRRQGAGRQPRLPALLEGARRGLCDR